MSTERRASSPLLHHPRYLSGLRAFRRAWKMHSNDLGATLHVHAPETVREAVGVAFGATTAEKTAWILVPHTHPRTLMLGSAGENLDVAELARHLEVSAADARVVARAATLAIRAFLEALSRDRERSASEAGRRG